MVDRGARVPGKRKHRPSDVAFGRKAVRTVYNNRSYASKREAMRARTLDLMQQAGEIESWEPQPSFPLSVNGIHITTYRADFRVCYKGGASVIEDVKGEIKTREYEIKKRLMAAIYKIAIREV